MIPDALLLPLILGVALVAMAIVALLVRRGPDVGADQDAQADQRPEHDRRGTERSP